MQKLTLVLALTVASLFAGGATNAVAGGMPNHQNHGTPHCPAGTKIVTDNVTGMALCQHKSVLGLTGHPAYDVKAACTPGEKRTIKVALPNGGHRDVYQTCTTNF